MELKPAERDFFRRVARAVFTNPFGDEWEKMESAPVTERIVALEREGRADLGDYRGEDEEVLRYTYLFDLYFRYRERFDGVIDAQLEAGEEPVAVPFAGEVLAELRRRGFSAASARRHFALFFQLRRAFFFIDRALVGTSPCMRALRRDLWNNIFTRDLRRYGELLWDRMEDFSTLLLGETGTGKGSAAAAIGRSGFLPLDRKDERFVESFTRAFVSLNLSQYPEQLIESALFGHEKGAFTGAMQATEGALAGCSPHGSVFLDEIGEVAAPVQIKLLRVLQERVFTPVGSNREKRFRGRVIAATNRSLDELRAEGAFRDDFFYRLCSDVIVVPPLRLRLEEDPNELGDLVKSVMTRLLGVEDAAVAADVRRTLENELGPRYPWPGNVRELEQAVRRVLLKGSYGGDLRGSAAVEAADPELRELHAGTMDARQVLAAYCAMLHRRHGSLAAVARVTRLDRRTVRKYVEESGAKVGFPQSRRPTHLPPDTQPRDDEPGTGQRSTI